jgi:hypothetical protein
MLNTGDFTASGIVSEMAIFHQISTFNLFNLFPGMCSAAQESHEPTPTFPIPNGVKLSLFGIIFVNRVDKHQQPAVFLDPETPYITIRR